MPNHEDAYWAQCQVDPKRLPQPSGRCGGCGRDLSEKAYPVDYGMDGWRCTCGRWANGPHVADEPERARACPAFMCLKPGKDDLGGVCGECGAESPTAGLFCLVCETHTLVPEVVFGTGLQAQCTRCRGVWPLAKVRFCLCADIGEMRVRDGVYHCSTCNLQVSEPDHDLRPSRWRKRDGEARCADCLGSWGPNHVCAPHAMEARSEARAVEVVHPVGVVATHPSPAGAFYDAVRKATRD